MRADPLLGEVHRRHVQRGRVGGVEDEPGDHLLAEKPEVRFLNREEDMGIANLRTAKEEWYPLYLLEKTTAVWCSAE